MLEADVVELCSRCLVVAAIHQGEPDDVDLYATALARDLTYANAAESGDLIKAASSDAIVVLDASELDAREFATALRRLAQITAGVERRLFGAGRSHGSQMPA